MNNNTRKNIGGDITQSNAFQHILSIGYEFETGSLAKLTKTDVAPVDEDKETPENVLFNSDTARKDIDEFKSKDFEYDEEDENMIYRLEEIVELPAKNSKGLIDKNILFYLTNDIAPTAMVNKLDAECSPYNGVIKKNDMYTFEASGGEVFNIQFLFHAERECSIFSDVEWLFTYLKPKKTGNVVIQTFSNMVQNLKEHLSDLEEIKGKFVLTMNGERVVINRPDERILYHKPNTNLYYLQTHYFKKEKHTKKPVGLNEICGTIQMTFSCDVLHTFSIMRSLLTDSKQSIESISAIFKRNKNVILDVQKCLTELMKPFHKKLKTTYELETNSTNDTLLKKFAYYGGLILFKLFLYYNKYLTTDKSKRKYFKNTLFFNVRHSNYVLYQNMKKKLSTLLKMNEDEPTVAKLIQDFFVQKDILLPYFKDSVDDKGTSVLRKGAFNLDNKLEIKSSSYGNPAYSLVSYFQFFENPTTLDNEAMDDTIIHYDWLEYKNIDAFSAKMDLVNDVVLIECRFFPRLLSSYLYSIEDRKLKKNLTSGICNQLANYYGEDLNSLSLDTLYKVFTHLNTSNHISISSRDYSYNKTRKSKKTV